VDLDADLAELAVEEAGGDAVAGEPRGLVDHDRIEPACSCVAGLVSERGPPRPIVLGARLLTEELGHDLPAELADLASAGLELRRAGEGLVLLVVSREAAVESEAKAHQITAAGWSERLVTIRAPRLPRPRAVARSRRGEALAGEPVPTGAKEEQPRSAATGEVECRGWTVRGDT
jgi:hypothetical protein